MANLARESEDWGTASTLYDKVMSVAARIGQPDVELGASHFVAMEKPAEVHELLLDLLDRVP